MTHRPARRSARRRPMPEYVQIEIMACVMLTAVIIGIVGAPIAYYIIHAL